MRCRFLMRIQAIIATIQATLAQISILQLKRQKKSSSLRRRKQVCDGNKLLSVQPYQMLLYLDDKVEENKGEEGEEEAEASQLEEQEEEAPSNAAPKPQAGTFPMHVS